MKISMLLFYFLLIGNVFSQEVIIRDAVTTGYKANISKIGTKYGLNTDSVPATTLYFNQKTVTTAGTRVQLSSSSVPIRSVCIKALHVVTGKIYVGDVAVSSSNGYELAADGSICLDINNLNLIYIDSSVNGEGVSYLGIN